MRKGEETRARLVQTARRLFESQGYTATGLQQLLAESKTPRGSFYFHFPGGKEDVAAAVVQAHAEAYSDGLDAIFEQAPDALSAAEASLDLLGAQVTQSGCRAGCPVGAITLEMANQSEALRTLTRAAFDRWRQQISLRLQAEGHAPAQADTTARALLCAIEGALLLCRAYADRGPLDDVRAQLSRWLAP